MKRYDLTAEMYEERYAVEQKEKFKVALENVRVARRTVLDVGCGSGLFFSHVATEAKLVIGVDISRKLLLKANDRAKAFGNVAVLQADADHLPVRDNLFDVIFSFTVLQNMPEPCDTLDEIKKASKRRGEIVVTGLKKAFPLDKFADILNGSGLRLVSFVEKEDLNCYVATLTN